MYLLFRHHPTGNALLGHEGNGDPVIWVAAHDESAIRAFLNLAKKLEHAGYNTRFLITAPANITRSFKPTNRIVFSNFPGERTRECRAFLKAWQPTLGFWVGSPLRPNLLHAAGRLSVPMVLLNATVETGSSDLGFFHSRATARSMRAFHVAFATSYASGGACIRRGIAEKNVHVLGPLPEGSVTLTCDYDELDSLSAALSKREIWFASDVPDDEIDHVLAAHETLRSTNRRLLLALNPAEGSNAETMAIALAAKGWRVGLQSKGDQINGQTQVYLVDQPNQNGLWFRLAPISYLGGTLSANNACRDPLQAAALGSAIVHGPRTSPYKDLFGRMHGMVPPAAAQIVSADNLAKVVSELLSPDVAAEQANSAWELVSRGAELTDLIFALSIEALELAETQNA